MSQDGKVIVQASTPDRPFEIFAAENGALRCLTKQNDAFLAQIQLGRVEETKFKSADGTEVHGFLVHPPNEKPGQKLPAFLRPHGGPQSQYANEFEFEKQLFAANGYAVVLPNPRGSTGRGTDYAMGIYASWGEHDVQDDLAAVDDAVARGIADPDRLVVGGWSYGGMSTNYLIATTTRFKAAVSGASISNILAGYGTDQYIRDYEYELGSPWAHPEVWAKVSYPFLHADKIKTPTLFLCGESDFNVPLLNSEQMYQALRTLGVPTELVIYPGNFTGSRSRVTSSIATSATSIGLRNISAPESRPLVGRDSVELGSALSLPDKPTPGSTESRPISARFCSTRGNDFTISLNGRCLTIPRGFALA